MANTAGPKGYTRKPYQQPRKSKNSDEEMGIGKKIIASYFQLLHEAGNPKAGRYRRKQGIPLYGTKKD